MTPILPHLYPVDRLARDPVFGGQFVPISTSFINLDGLWKRELLPASPPFPSHIDGIISIGPEEEMKRVYTCGVVAGMEDASSVWYGTEDARINLPRSKPRLVIDADYTITLQILAADPLPAQGIGNENLRHEPKPEFALEAPIRHVTFMRDSAGDVNAY